MSRNPVSGRKGFTLVETVIVIVLAGMLLTFAVPQFSESRRRYQVDTAAHQLAGDLRRAQVEAIRRNTPITLRRFDDSTYTVDFIGVRMLESGVTFAGWSADSVRMAVFGPPTTGARAFTVMRDGIQKTVTVSAAGLVAVQ
jgi:prepilin-type N-terminal cleavage/methylation domain-containing protein